MDTRVLQSSSQLSRTMPSSSAFPLKGLRAAKSVELNQVGDLDLGVDHLYASKTIFEVHAEGGKERMCQSQLVSDGSYMETNYGFFLEGPLKDKIGYLPLQKITRLDM